MDISVQIKGIHNMQICSFWKHFHQTCDPGSYHVPPDWRRETGLVGTFSDDAVMDGSTSLASRAVLTGM